jgi:hypothetical protein
MNIEHIIAEIEDCCGDHHRMKELLDKDINGTLNALIAITKKHPIDKSNNILGKLAWRATLQYLRKEEKLSEELRRVEKRLYEIMAPQKEQIMTELQVRLRTAVSRSTSFWDVYSHKEARKMMNEAYHNYAVKQFW